MQSNGSAAVATPCGVTLAGLAEQRGISKDAARRLVKAGKIEGHRVEGAHGPEWCAHPDAPATVAPGQHQPGTTVAPGVDGGGLVALVDRLTVENRQLAEAAAMWQARAGMLAERLALAAPEPTPAPWWRAWWPWRVPNI